MSGKPVTSSQLIGTSLGRERQRLGLRQDQFASFLRTRCGLGWTQTTIADLELGRRKLSHDESQALRQWIGLDKLLYSDSPVEMLGHVVSAATWNASLPKGTIKLVWSGEDEWTDPVGVAAATLQAEQRLARKLRVTAADIANAAIRKWGMTLTDKREVEFQKLRPRAADDSASNSSNRLRRSHITRKLEEDIKEVLRTDQLTLRAVNKKIHRRLS